MRRAAELDFPPLAESDAEICLGLCRRTTSAARPPSPPPSSPLHAHAPPAGLGGRGAAAAAPPPGGFAVSSDNLEISKWWWRGGRHGDSSCFYRGGCAAARLHGEQVPHRRTPPPPQKKNPKSPQNRWDWASTGEPRTRRGGVGRERGGLTERGGGGLCGNCLGAGRYGRGERTALGCKTSITSKKQKKKPKGLLAGGSFAGVRGGCRAGSPRSAAAAGNPRRCSGRALPL